MNDNEGGYNSLISNIPVKNNTDVSSKANDNISMLDLPTSSDTNNQMEIPETNMQLISPISKEYPEKCGYWFYISMALIVVVIICVILVIVYAVGGDEKKTVNVALNPLGLRTEPKNGSGLNLTRSECNGPNVQWDNVNNTCTCAFPYNGNICITQEVGPHYNYLGKISNPSNLNYGTQEFTECDPEYLTYLPNGNVDPDSCTSYCDKNNNCNGVVYTLLDGSYKCGMINQNIIIEKNGKLTIEQDQKQNIYFNNKRTNPKFTGQIFLYSNGLIQDYWLMHQEIVPVGSGKGFYNANEGNASHIAWYNPNNKGSTPPQWIINDGNLAGTWSNVPFDNNGRLAQGSQVTSWVDSGPVNGVTTYRLNFPESFLGSLYSEIDGNGNSTGNNIMYFKYMKK